MKTRRVDDDKGGSNNGTTFKDNLLSCSHFNVISSTYCCNVYNPFSKLNDTITFNVNTKCNKCKTEIKSKAERTSTNNGDEVGDIKCKCDNLGVAWVVSFLPWGHLELTKYAVDMLADVLKIAAKA